MTLYLVKHGAGDFRLHNPDGTEIDTYASDPREDANGNETNPVPDLVDSLAAAHNGASILGDKAARRDHAKATNGDWVFRDVAEHGASEVPW